jgi:hypothetical protein
MERPEGHGDFFNNGKDDNVRRREGAREQTPAPAAAGATDNVRRRRGIPCSSGAGGVGSNPANSDAQNVPSFRRW